MERMDNSFLDMDVSIIIIVLFKILLFKIHSARAKIVKNT